MEYPDEQVAQPKNVVDKLIMAIGEKNENAITDIVEQLKATPTDGSAKKGDILHGTWKLLWYKNGKNANWMQSLLIDNVSFREIIWDDEVDGPMLEHIVDVGPAKMRTFVYCKPVDDVRATCVIKEIFFEMFGGLLKIPAPFLFPRENIGWNDSLFVDDRVHVTAGNRGTTFILMRI